MTPRRLTPEEMFPARVPGWRASRVTTRSGISIRVIEAVGARAGGEASVVFCLHGWGCSAYTYRHVLPPLAAAGHRAIAIDLPGHGLSDKPMEEAYYQLDRMTATVAEVLDTLDLSSVVLVGHSMGGAIAARMAVRNAERVSALVLLAPAGFGTALPHKLARVASPAFLSPVLPRLMRRSVVGLTLRLARGRPERFTARDIDEYWAATQFPMFVQVSRTLLHRFDWRAGERGVFSGIGVPTALVYAGRDRLIPRWAALRYAEWIPGVRVRYVAESGHVIPDDVPETVVEAVLDLVAR